MATDGGAQAQATERETTQRFFLHDLEGKGVSFYSLSVEQTIHEALATAARFGRPLVMVSSSSNHPLMTGT
jgi:hypothetical protein